MPGLSLESANAGFLATVPMTAAMEGMYRELPMAERYPLPPREITQEFLRKIGIDHELTERQRQALSLACHFGYGAAMGEIYGLLTGGPQRRGALTGALFGLGVWGASYLGMLPAFELLPPATEHPPRRNALMIAAHLVWGASMGVLARHMNTNSDGSTGS